MFHREYLLPVFVHILSCSLETYARLSSYSFPTFGTDRRWSLDESRMICRKLDNRKTHPHHKVSAFEITVQVFESADLGIHHQRHNVALVVVTRRIPLPAHLPARTALS